MILFRSGYRPIIAYVTVIRRVFHTVLLTVEKEFICLNETQKVDKLKHIGLFSYASLI